jgi:cysteinyl-tRNA synthetase
MDDDFNTANAFAALHNMAAAVNRYIDSAGLETAEVGAGDDEQLALDARKRLAAAAGVTLVRTGRIVGLFLAPPERPAGGEGPDDAEIDRLVAERTEARKARDFARADAIRDQLAEMGITLEDTPSGVVWRRA